MAKSSIPSPRRILVVEDGPSIMAQIKDCLEEAQYEVLTATDGAAGLKLALANDPDLILLDIVMPKMSGIEVLRKLREERIRGSVIMLTAQKTEEDKVRGLTLGADDYISKPFSVAELLARVQAVLRRTSSPDDALRQVTFNDIKINFETHEAFKADTKLELTAREFKILRLLAEKPNRVVSREELLQKVWGYDVIPTTRTVDNHIAKLRKQIEDNPAEPEIITSVRGAGYKLSARVAADSEPTGDDS